ncbi:hypothetical protein C900_05416 [Fulvivirga imtechensis AK7]|uniref:Uncharacterized protein n=1 Tax=Fulvivirga imtechensis AK7 TaxID=1237149 RepID=L8JJQ0_9BACT|nr:hypothetical protein C900_05416 [Fulvivirga imtechensis AK7]
MGIEIHIFLRGVHQVEVQQKRIKPFNSTFFYNFLFFSTFWN